MNSQEFYLINLVIFVLLVLFFWFGRKTSKPVKLNLKNYNKNYNEILKSEDDKNEEKKFAQAREAKVSSVVIETTTKKLNQPAIFFVYNGHEWEAHEVLGLPKDATVAVTTTHYQKLIKTSDPSTFEFYESAYMAILKTKS